MKEKWKQQRRLLWVYFLTEPETLQGFIETLKENR